MAEKESGKIVRKVILPVLARSWVCSADDIGAQMREIREDGSAAVTYHYRYVSGKDTTDAEGYIKEHYNLFPLVLSRDGAPWEPAVAYIFGRLQQKAFPNMRTMHGIADDLGYFLDFLEDRGIEFDDFPSNKQRRPTYRFHGYLKQQIHARETASSTAQRRMGTVIGFYRWLLAEGLFAPAHPLWQETDQYLSFKDARGLAHAKHVKRTDVSIRAPRQTDPFDGTIDDGGKLRPLELGEQRWIIEALVGLQNVEMLLIHALMLTTGARIQTALTLRVRHVILEPPSGVAEIRMRVGPGTGIDTKNNKLMTLHIPRAVYERLRVYALSDRTIGRRLRAPGGDGPDQYLFLTQQGAPYYEAEEHSGVFDPTFSLRHRKRGQTVRVFVRDHVLPYIHEHFDGDFRYRIHDLRASFGMNLTDSVLRRVEQKEMTLLQARQFVSTRMGHDRTETTDQYLGFRQTMDAIVSAVDDHERYIQSLIAMAWGGKLGAE
ncbi:site-specific integrase [Burkholderia cepacia]|uniref:site-specific integrase n=1 Tax=Burkholderia cepacia TaxID=292 RepID=UPI00234BA859|nr:site-specific integrase [Burkholderia cepacia]MDC6099538.1 site-specific integrase [Burkholderia cepacia]